MRDERDAFGLLSLDWGGEPVTLKTESHEPASGNDIVPPHRALYGKGLLRAWAGNLYIRIMAFQDTPRVKDVILKNYFFSL
jgi:hypothetical protein